MDDFRLFTDTYQAARPRTIAYKPPDPKALERARNNRLKELKMYSILREIFSFFLFVWILLSVSYSFRDPKAFQLQQHMRSLMLRKPGTDIDFMKVGKEDKNPVENYTRLPHNSNSWIPEKNVRVIRNFELDDVF